MGCFAAIPAVVAYNRYSNDVERVSAAAEDFSSMSSPPFCSARLMSDHPGESYEPQRRQRRRPVSEINVVPYIDVMLVLLIIFMITAPLWLRVSMLIFPRRIGSPTDGGR